MIGGPFSKYVSGGANNESSPPTAIYALRKSHAMLLAALEDLVYQCKDLRDPYSLDQARAAIRAVKDGADRRAAQQAYLDSLGVLGKRMREFTRELNELIACYAGHLCRRCHAPITDHEYIEAGLFFSLCAGCLASARQTLKEDYSHG